jgi:tetratricopeptide (TPR) repeat protein
MCPDPSAEVLSSGESNLCILDRMSQNRSEYSQIALAAYLGTLLLFLIGSFFPQARLWGMNWWTWFPLWLRLSLFAVGVIAPWLIYKTCNRIYSGASDISGRWYALLSVLLVITASVAFYFLRVRTHFLGNGYTLLANLASSTPTTKGHEIGEELVHQWTKALIGGNTEATALLAYQTVSILVGIIFVLAVVYFAKRLFESRLDRLLFLLTLLSGGYMLLFFGYVENRTLLCLLIGLFTLTGLLISQGRANRWFILPPLGLALVTHIFAVALIPSAVYLLLPGTTFGDRCAALSMRAKSAVTIVAVSLALGAFAYEFFSDYFFRFAVVAPVTDRYTEAGYTMFSLKHVLDYVNLLFVLSPGVLVTVVLLLRRGESLLWQNRTVRFLIVLVAASLAEAFVFDPRLGMPRDWDLMAFPGIPLAALAFFIAWRPSKGLNTSLAVRFLIPLLGFMLLAPRVMTQVDSSQSIELLRTYYRLDRERNSSVRYVLVKYLEQKGDSAQADRERKLFKADFPHFDKLQSCAELLKAQKFREAVKCYQQGIAVDVRRAEAWANLGKAYDGLQLYDSAAWALRVADGLRPHYMSILRDLSYTYVQLKEYDQAEHYGLEAWRLAPNDLACQTALTTLYAETGQGGKCDRYLELILKRNDLAIEYVAALGDRLTQFGRFSLAAPVYRRALAMGLDSAYVRKQAQKHPELLQAMGQH